MPTRWSPPAQALSGDAGRGVSYLSAPGVWKATLEKGAAMRRIFEITFLLFSAAFALLLFAILLSPLATPELW